MKIWLLVLAIACCAFVRKVNLVVPAGQPHPYGFWQNGEVQDPYLCGDMVVLDWEYAGDEASVLPYPGYTLERKVNEGEWVVLWDYLEQRWTGDWIGWLKYGDWVFYRVKIQRPRLKPLYSPVVGFEYIPHVQ